MKKIILLVFLISISLFAEEGHDEENHDDHGEGAANAAIGPNKGITEKGKLGFKISEEAVKTFSLKLIEVKDSVLKIPRSSLVKIKDEKFVYRVRDSWYIRVPVEVLNKDKNEITIKSAELSNKDQIVSEGIGFLRTVEVFSEEGAEHSHAH